jgi:hypothetical protein
MPKGCLIFSMNLQITPTPCLPAGRQPSPIEGGGDVGGILLLLGFSQYFLKECVIQEFAFCNILAIFDEVDNIHACNLLGIEGTKSQEGLTHHVGGQPMPVVVLGLIPEEFLFGPYRVN